MNACLLAGLRALRRVAIGDAMVKGCAEFEDIFAGVGKAVMVCEVEVIDEDALLLLAIAIKVNLRLDFESFGNF